LKKKGSARPRASPLLREQEFVREVVSRATGVHFEVVPPHPAFPIPAGNLGWFMRCRNRDEIAKSPHLNTVWKERGDGIWLESLAVGDTVDWIEIAYGDEKAEGSLDIDYSRFDDPAFQADFRARFPLVLGRIREYEEVAAEVSKRRRAHLEVRRTGSRGMLVFTVAARVRIPKSGAQSALGTAIRREAAALMEAYQKVEEI
jgi:hypothetical protein